MTELGGLKTRDLWEDWAGRMCARRGELGLSQNELARISGVSQTTVNAMERGISGGKDHMRYALARALRIEVHELFPYPAINRAAS